MKRTRLLTTALISAMLSTGLYTSQSSAQGLGQGSAPIKLDTLIVSEENNQDQRSSTSQSIPDAREKLSNIPGGIGFVETEEYEEQFIQSLGDTLVFTPGVYADTSAQRESRISIRGSGLNATFERRGINVYHDNVPITRASGMTEFQEIDPVSIKYLEVYKGANAAALGSATLGGAINVVTPTVYNTSPGTTIRAEGGSFGTQRFNINTTGKQNNIDYYASLTKLDSDGFRAHSDVDSLYGFANVGIKVSDRVETRFYFTAIDDRFELAGSVSQDDALENPETAVSANFYPAFLGGPSTFSAIDDDWDRNLEVNRLSNKTTFTFEQSQLEVGSWLSNRKLDHSITRFAGIIDQDEDETGLSLRMSNDNIDDAANKWTLSVVGNISENDAKRWFNILGERSDLRSQDTQNADNFTVLGQLNTAIGDQLRLIISGQHFHATREEVGTGTLSFDHFNSSIGLLWNSNERHQWYTNISQSYEPPGISDLTSGGSNDFDPLEAQEGTTFEIGTRGKNHAMSWDVSVYHSRIENEFIDTKNPARPSVTITTNSVSDTTHQGIEAGVNFYPSIAALENNDLSLAWKNSLTYNDFHFDNHPTFGNNRLAGVPEFIALSELRLDGVDDWYSSITVRNIPKGPFLDFANTTQVGGYTLIGLTVGWSISPDFRIFSSIENLTNRRYVSNVSTVFEGDASDALFTAGQGRAFYLGVTIEL